jgi:hypothetical protein
MGYQITVKSNAGSCTVAVEGDLPDGEHVITGHDLDGVVSLHCERRSELGRYIVHAKASAEPPQPGPQVVAQRDPDS